MKPEPSESQDFLNQFAGRQFYKPPRSREIIAVFMKAEPVQNHFQKSQTIVRYHLVIDGVHETLDRGSKDLARQMSAVPVGSRISMYVTGEKTETKYQIKVLE